jgi:hypothetical protein
MARLGGEAAYRHLPNFGRAMSGGLMATALVDLYGGEPLPFDRLILAEGYRPSDGE